MNVKKYISTALLALLSIGSLMALSGCFYEEHDARWYHDHPGYYHDEHGDHWDHDHR